MFYGDFLHQEIVFMVFFLIAYWNIKEFSANFEREDSIKINSVSRIVEEILAKPEDL